MSRAVQLECTSSEWLMKRAHTVSLGLLKESWHRWTGWRCCFLYKESADTYGPRRCDDVIKIMIQTISKQLLLLRVCGGGRFACARVSASATPTLSKQLFVALAARCTWCHLCAFLYFIFARAHASALPLLELRAERCEGREAIPKVVYMWVLFPVSPSFYGVFMAPRLYSSLDLRTV